MSDPIRPAITDLSTYCFPWDNDPGLLAGTGLGPPRECLTPHTIITPDAAFDDDEQTPLWAGELVVNVTSKAPPESPLQSAVRRGIAHFPTQDQFEKQLLWKENHPARQWSIERWHDYVQGPPPEHLTEAKKLDWQKAATGWQEYVRASYNQAFEAAEAKLLGNYKRIDAANGAVKGYVKSLPLQVLFAAVPATGAVYAGWTTGVSGVEAVTGRNSGLQPGDLVSGNWNDHRDLSWPERFARGAEAVIGATLIGAGYASERSAAGAGKTPPATTPTPAVATRTTAASEAGASTPLSSQPVRYASNDAFIYSGREVRIVQTPEGPMAFYKRTGDGGVSPFGAQPGDWVPFEGLMVEGPGGGAHFVKPTSVRTFDPSQPLTLYRWETESARRVNEWIKANPLPGAVDVGNDWRRVQLALERAGVPVMCPIRD